MKTRAVIGLVAGAMLLLSAAAHSLAGWPMLREQLVMAAAPPDLVTGLALGWHFAGLAMLVFGVEIVLLFAAALKGRAVSLRPAALMGAAYMLFGGGALVASAWDPFFMVFIVPGALLLAASARF